MQNLSSKSFNTCDTVIFIKIKVFSLPPRLASTLVSSRARNIGAHQQYQKRVSNRERLCGRLYSARRSLHSLLFDPLRNPSSIEKIARPLPVRFRDRVSVPWPVAAPAAASPLDGTVLVSSALPMLRLTTLVEWKFASRLRPHHLHYLTMLPNSSSYSHLIHPRV